MHTFRHRRQSHLYKLEFEIFQHLIYILRRCLDDALYDCMVADDQSTVLKYAGVQDVPPLTGRELLYVNSSLESIP